MTPPNTHSIARSVQSIPGWLWPREIGALCLLLQDSKLHAEVGTFCGKSLYATAAAMTDGHIVVVDPLSDKIIPELGEISPDIIWNAAVLNATLAAIERNLTTTAKWWRESSISALNKAHKNKLVFDSVYIDGDHHYAECSADIMGWKELVRPGGIICGHDYYPTCPGVVDAVNDAFGGEHQLLPETRIWYYRIPEKD